MNWKDFDPKKFAGLRKWALSVVGVAAVVGVTALDSFVGVPDYQTAISAILALTATSVGIQAFLDFLKQRKE